MNAASTTSQFPTFRKAGALLLRFIKACAQRIQRLFLSRTSIKVYLITATLICLTYTSLRWVGRRALQAEQERVAALGMATDRSQLVASPLLNEDNFFAAPPFTGLFTVKELNMWFSQKFLRVKMPDGRVEYRHLRDRNSNTLAEWCDTFRWVGSLPATPTQNSPAAELLADRRWEPIVHAVYAAASRPSATLREKLAGVDASLVTSGLYGSLKLYARAQLEVGNAALAAPYFKANRHRIRGLTAQLDSLAVLSASRSLHSQKSLLLQGIAAHQWPESVLQEIADTNYPALFEASSRRELELIRLDFTNLFERALIPPNIFVRQGSTKEFFWKLITPDYYFTTTAARYSQFYAGLRTAARPLRNDEDWNSRVSELAASPDSRWLTVPGDQQQVFIGSHFAPIIRASLQHLSVILELHYLRHKSYPPTLEELEPRLPSRLLMELDGQKISYTTNPKRTCFTLIPVHLNRLTDPHLHDQFGLVYSTDPERLPK